MINKDVSISVVVPVSNMAGRLGRLESWIRDAGNRIEVIIVHDYRDQQTYEELLGLSKKYEFKIINGTYGSPGAARNAGIEESTKDWIIFVDSDDFPEITNYIEMIRNAEILQCNVSVGSYFVKDSTTELKLWESIIPAAQKEQAKYLGIDPGIWRYAFKSEVITGIKFPNLSMAEDIVFLSQIYAKQPSIYLSGNIVYNYFRNHPNQLTHGKSLHEDSLRSLELLLRISQKNGTKILSTPFFFYVKLFNTIMVRGSYIERLNAVRFTANFVRDQKSWGKFTMTELNLAWNAAVNLLKVLVKKFEVSP
jgi:glycosyltransferase involved in cell wall biosynthesis